MMYAQHSVGCTKAVHVLEALHRLYVQEEGRPPILFMWDEIQYLLRLESGPSFKFVISNQNLRGIVSVVSGSGMALAWDAFHRFTKSGHSFLTHLQVIHLPFKASTEDAFKLVLMELHREFPSLQGDVVQYALSICHLSIVGLVYYITIMRQAKSVPYLSLICVPC